MTDEPDEETRRTDPWIRAANQERKEADVVPLQRRPPTAFAHAGQAPPPREVRGMDIAGAIVPPAPEPKEASPLSNPLTTPQQRGTIKPGVQTTEFLLTIAADAVAVLNADRVWTWFSPQTSGIIMAAVTGLYALSRGWAKSGS